MGVLADLSESEKYLLAILMDQSGIDQAEFVWRDDTQPDWLFRCWDFQIPWYRHQDKFQIDQCGRALGKSVGIQMRAFSFPFVNPGEEMLVTAPEMIHLDPVTKNIEDRLESCRLSREFLKRGGTSNGFSHRPFEAKFRNGARIVGRIPQKDGRGVKGSLGLDTLVTTVAGDKPIGDIQVGDLVLTVYNRFMPVLHVYRHTAPCVLVCSDTRFIVASTNHRVRALRDQESPTWLIVDDEDADGYNWAMLLDGHPVMEPIGSVTPLGEREVIDLVVAEDFSYVAEGVVHKGSRFLPGDDVILRN